MVGVYSIVNRTNGHCYVGSSKNIDKRWERHRYLLCKGTHHSPYLQNAWNKYGEDSFSFEIIENVEDDTKLREREQFWLDSLKPTYNIAKEAGRPTEACHRALVKGAIPDTFSDQEKEALVNFRKGFTGTGWQRFKAFLSDPEAKPVPRRRKAAAQ